MDAARFDRLAKVLANRRSRRTALRAGGVGLALGALSRAGLPTRAQEATRTEGVPIEILYVQVATMWESSRYAGCLDFQTAGAFPRSGC